MKVPFLVDRNGVFCCGCPVECPPCPAPLAPLNRRLFNWGREELSYWGKFEYISLEQSLFNWGAFSPKFSALSYSWNVYPGISIE